jgi:hypothetical protein
MEMEGTRGDSRMGCVIQCIGRGFEQSALRTYLRDLPDPPGRPSCTLVFRCNARDGDHRWFKTTEPVLVAATAAPTRRTLSRP